MTEPMTNAEYRVWQHASDRAQAKGYDDGYVMYAAEQAVLRFRTKQRKDRHRGSIHPAPTSRSRINGTT